MEKILTVAVPCFNAEWCLDKCLSSFIDTPVQDLLEIIIINDGSTDYTLEIALKYQERYPNLFTVVDKENGGHGSGINVAVKMATGKYFKVVDSDDWVVTENLEPFIDILKNTDVDVVLTHFYTENMVTGQRQSFKTRDIPLGKIYSLDEFTKFHGNIYPCASFHGLTYRTAVYRESKTVLSEGIFYEDQEYATLPFTKAQTVLPLDLFIYEYLIGNANQSVSDNNQVKRLSHVEQVVCKLFECYHLSSNLSIGARKYISHKATELLLSYYVIALVKNSNKKEGRKEARRIRANMQLLGPELVKDTNSRYRVALIMNFLGFNSKMLELMKLPLPYFIFRKLFKRNKG